MQVKTLHFAHLVLCMRRSLLIICKSGPPKPGTHKRKQLSKKSREAISSAVSPPCAHKFWWDFCLARSWDKYISCLIIFASPKFTCTRKETAELTASQDLLLSCSSRVCQALRTNPNTWSTIFAIIITEFYISYQQLILNLFITYNSETVIYYCWYLAQVQFVVALCEIFLPVNCTNYMNCINLYHRNTIIFTESQYM